MTPRLRNVNKIPPPYPLGQFPSNFIVSVGREIVYLLCTKSETSLEGAEWERIFAKAIGAQWKPSAVGLCAWSVISKARPTYQRQKFAVIFFRRESYQQKSRPCFNRARGCRDMECPR